MKKIVLSLVLAAGTILVSAQNTAKDFFSKKEMVWYGLNFAEAKMVGNFDQIGGAGESTAKELRNKWMSSWNGLMIAEAKNFKMAESFDKDEIINDISSTEKMNMAINTDQLVQLESYEFKDAQKVVKNIISKLSGEKSEGIGCVFIVESFNKSMEMATVYVTIFDIKTKNILIMEKMVGKAMGIGLRNYWAGAIKAIIKQVKTDYYKKWKSKN